MTLMRASGNARKRMLSPGPGGYIDGNQGGETILLKELKRDRCDDGLALTLSRTETPPTPSLSHGNCDS